MFGFGKKDEQGKQVRIEHRRKHTRASRTGGIAVRGEQSVGPVNVTANSSKGVRASSRIANGTRIALQNGRFQLIGRWRAGSLGFNLSKTGVSSSIKNGAGTFNFVKPQYSSFKLAGVQLRGKKAANLQIAYMLVTGALLLSVLTLRLALTVAWMLVLLGLFFWDVATGFIRGVREGEDTDNPAFDAVARNDSAE
ncbi:hypothetical protein GCM10011363_42880 [Marivita lacus]|uniref:DUF4236 domain-containing protein n=1 Tax=Marivita lacus TaxID=1323742 RepID=A0ABQ1L9S3_9RHOB|nr:hypothetical protein [Marivita lacus]GGC21647.1 hypothetical protein GCM10011363_42880 [Marivita lacus]